MYKNKGLKLIPYYKEEINFKQTISLSGLKLAQKEGLQGDGVTIAILDTGIEKQHELLKDNIIHGISFTDNSEDYNDNNGHGTHVAGIIKQIAPLVKLVIIKVLDDDGNGKYSSLIKAINYSMHWHGPKNEKINIICMSLGGPAPDTELLNSIKSAISNNISIITAAGNNGDGNLKTFEYSYPAAFNEVISVGAVDNNLEIAYFSNTNNEIDLLAPGVNIYSSHLENTYKILSGTSMAAPHVAGALALIKNITFKQFKRDLSESELYAQLIKRTYPISHNKLGTGNGFLHLGLENELINKFKSRK